MITKGIIEEIVDSSQAKVRIPFLNGYSGLSNSTSSSALANAQISTAFGVYPNLNKGDEVYVAFENGYIDKPVIIGTVVTSNPRIDLEKGHGDASFDNLTVTGRVTLPVHTMLGSMSLADLLGIVGKGGSLNESIDTINTKLLDIYDIISKSSKSPEFEVSGYSGEFDGEPHGPCVNVKDDDTTVLFSSDNINFTSVAPTYLIGSHKVYVKEEVEIDIHPHPISFDLKESTFNFTGEIITPEIIFNTLGEATDVTADSISYFDENGNELSQLIYPGTYKMTINSIKGEDSIYYSVPEDLSTTVNIVNPQ